jgi:hypothetical protein
MSADRFRLVAFVLIVVVLAGLAWAVQWRYVTADHGVLLRFNRFTGSQEAYMCGDRPFSKIDLYYNRDCSWVRR